jgi:hypothetical protein
LVGTREETLLSHLVGSRIMFSTKLEVKENTVSSGARGQVADVEAPPEASWGSKATPIEPVMCERPRKLNMRSNPSTGV